MLAYVGEWTWEMFSGVLVLGLDRFDIQHFPIIITGDFSVRLTIKYVLKNVLLGSDAAFSHSMSRPQQ